MLYNHGEHWAPLGLEFVLKLILPDFSMLISYFGECKVKELCKSIISSQQEEIDQMKAKLKEGS
jgi:hypothetical protein